MHTQLAKLHQEAADLRTVQPGQKQAPKLGQAYFGSKRRAYLNLLGDEERADFHAADKAYWAWTEGRGPKPAPWQGGELDAVNEALGRAKTKRGFKVIDNRVSSLAEAWDRLVGQAKRWDSDKVLRAIALLREVPGLERIQLPDAAQAAVEAKATAEHEKQARDAVVTEGQIDDKLIDMSEKDSAFDPNAGADTSFEFGANVANL